MSKSIRHIQWFMSSILTLMLLSCSSSSSEEEVAGKDPTEPTMLTVYVYSPENPVLTRADVGEIDATSAEIVVKGLQIWIYETQSGKKVGHLSTEETATLNMTEGAVYQIPVNDDFAKRKPSVDVYVVANVTAANCGIGTLNGESSWDYLVENAKIDEDHFGLTALTTDVPTDGLPMAGELKNQPVVGNAPVLRVGSLSKIATVPLTRAVSKMRFVFANTANAAKLSIKGITLKENMIPTVEYLFANSQPLSYNSTTAPLLPTAIDEVKSTANPADYVYNAQTQTAQQYEERIATGISNNELSPVGPYYLRESNKRLEGTITYQVEGQDAQTTTFRMSEAGDFKRNHSWIVYAYYEGLNGMSIVAVDVTPWVPTTGSHSVYNW